MGQPKGQQLLQPLELVYRQIHLHLRPPTSTASLPEVPTLDESAAPGYECEIWLGLSAPAGTPAPVVDAINQAVRRVMALPDVAQRLNGQGIEVLTSSPEQMRQRAADDLKRWTEVIRTAGIKAE